MSSHLSLQITEHMALVIQVLEDKNERGCWWCVDGCLGVLSDNKKPFRYLYIFKLRFKKFFLFIRECKITTKLEITVIR